MRKRVLVTNDDGPGAPGLIALVKAAIALDWHVTVAVPAADMSHSGTSLGHALTQPVAITSSAPQNWEFSPESYLELRATPAAIITLAAMNAFGPRPDLVLVGINPGINVGRGLIHSSTVGAALTAAVHGIPAAAVSAKCQPQLTIDWHDALVVLLASLPERWPPDGIVNVNLPEQPIADSCQLAWCVPATSAAQGTLMTEGNDLSLSYAPLLHRPPADTDFGMVLNGGVALSWLDLPYASKNFTSVWGNDLITRFQAQWPCLHAQEGHER